MMMTFDGVHWQGWLGFLEFALIALMMMALFLECIGWRWLLRICVDDDSF